MADFNSLRNQLLQARQRRDAATTGVAAARATAKRAAAATSRASRTLDPNNPDHANQQQKLNAQGMGADTQAQAQGAALASANQALASALGAFAPYTDPRTYVRELDDAYPVLLLPVRLETRFKQITSADRTHHELWVRVYPDDCAIDTFEPMLSESELQDAGAYWTAMWAAGGIEAQARAAWRALVASHGSGRSAWIVQEYQPTNLATKPTKAAASDVILTIATDAPPASAEQAALATYWSAVWRADGDAALIAAAAGALSAAVGAARAQALITAYVPANIGVLPQTGTTRATVGLQTAFVLFPQNIPTQTSSWTQAAKVDVLPERFVLIGYDGATVAFEQVGALIPSPLVVGPDPSASPGQAIHQQGDEIVVGDDLRWMVDFEQAVAQGLGFKVEITDAQARAGFDRLVVLGVRLAADASTGQQQLQTLLTHHQYSREGMGLIAQGTPTNNTDNTTSGYSRNDDPDVSYDDWFKNPSLVTLTPDVLAKQDGQWLADYLGIEPALLAHVHNAGVTDQAEARAMNIALWPATLGYMMDAMLNPVFDAADVENVYGFFTRFVSGRGAIPAIRIGRQPYGILPATAFSRMSWMTPGVMPDNTALPGTAFLQRLYGILRAIDADWATMARDAKHIGQTGDPQQTLLDVLGLHASSVEYYQRYAESLDQLFNRLNLEGVGEELVGAISAAGYVQSGMDLLQRLGYTGTQQPDILKKFFLTEQQWLQGPVIDDRPLSETAAVRAYTSDGKNYLDWLLDAARSVPDRLRVQSGFIDDTPPEALLYLFLRHALLMNYFNAGLRAHETAAIMSAAEVKAAKRESPFVHVQGVTQSESRWQYLYKTDARITGDPAMRVIDYLATHRGTVVTQYLDEQLNALDVLRSLPTARLERAFAEHIDCCSYRFDAWWLGLVHYQLALMREQKAERGARQGVHIGAYGWLEDVRPRAGTLSTVSLPPELDQVFNKPGEAPLMRDDRNGGFIQAPSLNHAATAAVLRAGYLADSSAQNAQTLAVNLSSARVRRAMLLLEGIRSGQTLGALLGYQLERGLHDRHGLAEVDSFIYALRKAFPLVADRIDSTKTPSDVPIEAIEARNVVDGVALVAWVTGSGNQTYPFGKTLPAATPPQVAAINAEVARLLDTHDALADLMLAEGVHQAVQGNFDRSAAALDDLSKGHFPPDPDVVRTPRSGITLTHRVGLHLQAGLDPTVSPWPGIVMTPRAVTEPALNDALARVLPAPDTIACRVTYFDPVSAALADRTVTVKDLALQPIDLLYLVPAQGTQAMTELDDRIARHIAQTYAPRPDAELTIHYIERPAGKVSLFEISALLKPLRTLALHSRPLQPSDVMLHNEARAGQDEAVFVDAARITATRAALAAAKTALTAFTGPLETLLADATANRATLIAGVDTAIAQFTGAVAGAAAFGIPHAGFGFAYSRKRELYTEILTLVRALTDRWQDRLVRFDGLIADYGSLPAGATDDVRFALLRKAEQLVTTDLANPLPASPTAFLSVLDAKRTAFAARLTQFEAVLTTAVTEVSALLSGVVALLPVSDFDRQGIDLTTTGDAVIALLQDLDTVAKGLTATVDQRLAAADAQIALYGTVAGNRARVDALTAAAKALLGEDFVLVPEFMPGEAQANEWVQALAASASGELLRHQVVDLQNAFPVDEWLYGVARVRRKMRAWEQATLLAEAVGGTGLDAMPMQLPYQTGDHWLGLAFPSTYVIDGDRLAYTAHYTAPFAKGARQCGLLIDEWTEVIPARKETAGVAFHYDRPNAEPPQAMLLVTPAAFTGAWRWEDLVDAVNETLDLAKKRAVEPSQVDATAYARFLPATLMATTLYQISISANLAENNRLYARLAQEIHG